MCSSDLRQHHLEDDDEDGDADDHAEHRLRAVDADSPCQQHGDHAVDDRNEQTEWCEQQDGIVEVLADGARSRAPLGDRCRRRAGTGTLWSADLSLGLLLFHGAPPRDRDRQQFHPGPARMSSDLGGVMDSVRRAFATQQQSLSIISKNISSATVEVTGGATIYFHDENFIKWKPTILYWVFALALFVAQVGFRNNLVRKVMEAQIKLPEPVWAKVGYAWMTFFALVGVLNLVMAFIVFKDNTGAWVSFKLFGVTGIFFTFIVVQTLMLSKHIQEQEQGQGDA